MDKDARGTVVVMMNQAYIKSFQSLSLRLLHEAVHAAWDGEVVSK